FMLLAAYAAWTSGVVSGLLCAILGALASAMLYSAPTPFFEALTHWQFGVAWQRLTAPTDSVLRYGPDDHFRVIFLSVVLPGIALVVAAMRSRVVAALQRPVRERDELFAAIMASLHDAILMTDAHGISNVNASFCKMTGFDRAELLGAKPPYPFWPAEEYATITAALETAQRDAARDFELVLTRKNGERFPALLAVSRIVNAGVQSGRVVYSFKDISDLKRTEESLRGSEQRFRRLYEDAPLGYQSLNSAGQIIEVNATWLKLLGYTRDEVVGRKFVEFWSPATQPLFPDRFASFCARGEIHAVEFELIRKDGRQLNVLIDGTISRDEQGHFRQTHCILTDITPRKVVERESAEVQARLQAAFWNLPFDFWIMGPDRRYAFQNKRSLELWGPLLGKTLNDAEHKNELWEHWQENNERAFAGEVVQSQEWQEFGGQRRFVEEIVAPILVEGQIRGILGTNIDLTQRRRGEQMLTAQRRILELIATGAALQRTLEILIESIQEQVPEGVCSLMRADLKSRQLFVWVAPSLPPEFATAANGLSIGEGQGSCGTAAQRGQRVISADILHDSAWAPIHGLAEKCALRACVSEPVLARNGEVLGTFALYFHEPRVPGAEHLQLLELASHLAAIAIERRREEQTMKKSETELRLANQAKDRFLAVLSHELRTPLTPILAAASALVGDNQLPAKIRDELEMIRRNAESEARLIDDLLELTQLTRAQGSVDLPALDLGVLLRQTADGLNDMLQSRMVEWRWHLPAQETEVVSAEVRRLGQALRSALRFAVRRASAILPEGQLTAPVTGDPGIVDITLEPQHDLASGRRSWRIIIRDHGPILSAASLIPLFDLFGSARESSVPESVAAPTAKEPMRGMAEIGLALARAVVESYGGTLTAQVGTGRPGEASLSLIIDLPASASPLTPPPELAPQTESVGALRILLVEDHPDTQRVLGHLLRRIGYHVSLAGSVA
ncbi:MAG: PAS domain S-box protein, partial [Phycisphaerae bacterium]